MRKEKGNENQDERKSWLPAKVLSGLDLALRNLQERRTTMRTKTNIKAGFLKKR
jgi:hypothetical protein